MSQELDPNKRFLKESNSFESGVPREKRNNLHGHIGLVQVRRISGSSRGFSQT